MKMPIGERLYNKKRSEAKSRGIAWELREDQFANLVSRRCHYCGAGPSNQFKRGDEVLAYSGLDRVNSALPYSPGNVVPCCRFCNVLKSAMPPDTWFDFLVGVIGYHGGQPPIHWITDFQDLDRPKKAPNFWSRPRGR